MSRLTRDGTAEPVSRDQILRHTRGQRNIHFPCSADHEQDWQPYPVDPYSAICDDHTYIHTYIVYTTMFTVMYTGWLGQSDHIVEKPCTVAFVVFEVSVLLVLCVACNIYRQGTDLIIVRIIRGDTISTGNFCITIKSTQRENLNL